MNQPSGFCVNCGKPMDAAAKFCVSCGTVRAQAAPVTDTPPEDVPPPPPPRATVLPPVVASGPAATIPPSSTPRSDSPRSPNRNRAIVVGIIVGIVIVALAGVGWTQLSSDKSAAPATPQATIPTTTTSPIPSTAAPTEPPPSAAIPVETPAGQAKALNALLDQSAAARSSIAGGVNDISSCRNVAAGVQIFQTAGSRRQQLLDKLQRQSLTLLPNPDALRSALSAAWQNSIQADAQYAAWGTDLESGCTSSTSTDDSHWRAAQSIDQSSTAAKRQFAELWNQIAAQFGLPLQNADSI
jgi:hypothetical protein